jgi:cytochrome c oxidase cbb3-type subunit 1
MSRASGTSVVDLPLVHANLVAGFAWFLVSILLGFFFSFHFLGLNPFPGMELLSGGRLRMAHTNLLAYGFLVTSFMGLMQYVVPKLTGRPVLSRKLGWAIFWIWNALMAGVLHGILTGHAQGIEWAETPTYLDPLIVVGVALFIVNLFAPILRSGEKSFYVSIWYIVAALVWTALNYVMGNFLPQYFVAGTAGAAITSMYIHDLVGLFVTPIGVGVTYYLLPVVLRRPIHSHALSLIGFWGLAFFYPLNSVHHYLYSPIPMWVQYASVVVSVGVHVVVYTVLYNFYATWKGRTSEFGPNLPLRWILAGSVAYLLTCIQCAFQVTLTAQQTIHFTDWVVGHAHLVLFGTFGFWVFAWIHHVWPKVYGGAPGISAEGGLWSRKLSEWHFWLSAIGLGVMWLDLLVAGVIQGTLWKNLSPFMDSVTASRPYWITRSISGTAIVVGQFLFAWNLWRTARAARARAAAAPPPAIEPATVTA